MIVGYGLFNGATDTRAWIDLNGNAVPELNELGPSNGFNIGTTNRLSSDLQRPYVNELNLEDVNFLIESLRYTKRNFESTNYPTEALRRQQLEQVDQVMEKLRRIRDSLK